MQYLVTMDFVDPGPLLPIQQYAGMMRQAVLPRTPKILAPKMGPPATPPHHEKPISGPPEPTLPLTKQALRKSFANGRSGAQA